MRRFWFAVLGVIFGIAGVAFLAAFGAPATDPAALVTFALWFAASALYVLGGLEVAVADLKWDQLVGVGNVCLGLQQTVRLGVWFAGGSGETETLAVTVASGVGGLALAYIGLDWVRGGRHFDLSGFGEDPPTDPE
ncbi:MULTISPECIES: hypothetical protein [Halorussus]|uniref:hypothetical protein n=1 Tax=Halorussus TaxID=1070314 RepID=UPI000E210F4B|nr:MULTISPECIES: hypothetical protein [Halorussus]NHN57566.1 hypothetical protein [Halorussus sp. JP-T4]